MKRLRAISTLILARHRARPVVQRDVRVGRERKKFNLLSYAAYLDYYDQCSGRTFIESSTFVEDLVWFYGW